MTKAEIAEPTLVASQPNVIDNFKGRAQQSVLLGWLKFIVVLAVAYFILVNSIGLTLVSGNSMNPTLKDNSLLLVNKFSVHLSSPKYGDVVIVSQGGYDIIKRVIGLPGDAVSISDGVVYVNKRPLPEIYTTGKADDMQAVSVGQGKIFVMGDNRTPGESLDSRAPNLGPLPIEDIKGYAELSILPMYRIMKPLKLG